jgi:tetratricopeptide (TPR) repeat protein
MRRYERQLLPVLMAAILSASSLALAQSSGNPSLSPPPSVAEPATSTAKSIVDPTPEQIGDALMAHQRYQAAIEAYKKAPKNDADAWNKLGIAYQLMFNLNDAMHCYRTSSKLNPKNANVLNNLGTVYDALKQYHNAEKMYRKALKLDPQSALILKNLGTNLLAQHRFAKGWQEYQAALKIDSGILDGNTGPRVENPASASDRGAMNYYLARGCAKAGMNARAIQYLRMAINEGYANPKKIIADEEFAGLHGIPAFEQLLVSESQKRQ